MKMLNESVVEQETMNQAAAEFARCIRTEVPALAEASASAAAAPAEPACLKAAAGIPEEVLVYIGENSLAALSAAAGFEDGPQRIKAVSSALLPAVGAFLSKLLGRPVASLGGDFAPAAGETPAAPAGGQLISIKAGAGEKAVFVTLALPAGLQAKNPVRGAGAADWGKLPAQPHKPAAPAAGGMGMILDVPVQLSVELGRTKLPLREVMELREGSVVQLNKSAGEPVCLYVNDQLVARGEIVLVEDFLGVRVTEITGEMQ